MNFPKEIIEELLFRLPVKSLMKFKCMSKDWYRLISTSDFRKHYLSKQQNKRYAPIGFICQADSSDRFEDCSNKIFLYASKDYEEKEEFKSLDYLKEFSVIAASKGVLLLNYNLKSLCIYDLVSKKQVNFPKIPEVISSLLYVSFGFKCEEENNEHDPDNHRRFRYKVLGLKMGDSSYGLCVRCWTYSSESRTWQKSILKAKSLFDMRPSTTAKVINGVFHWHASNTHIVAYDSNDPSERLVVIALPISLSQNVPYSERSKMLEATKDGSLQLVNVKFMIVDVWILGTFGKRYMDESIVDVSNWSLVHSVNLLDIDRFQNLLRNPSSHCIAINPADANTIYLEIENRLYAYNYHEGKVIYTSSKKIPLDICIHRQQRLFVDMEWPIWPLPLARQSSNAKIT